MHYDERSEDDPVISSWLVKSIKVSTAFMSNSQNVHASNENKAFEFEYSIVDNTILLSYNLNNWDLAHWVTECFLLIFTQCLITIENEQ